MYLHVCKHLICCCKTLQENNAFCHRFKLAHSHTHLDKRKYFFTNRVVSLWNDLSDDVVSAQTVNSFKSKLDKFWSLQHCKYEWRAVITGTGAK
jgi:hypothetical protein